MESLGLKRGDTDPHTIESRSNLIELYETRNKPEEANEWRAIRTRIEGYIPW